MFKRQTIISRCFGGSISLCQWNMFRDQKSARVSMQAGMQLLELPDAEAQRMTKDQNGPQKSSWFCLTLLSQATGRFRDQDWLMALDKDPTELLANLHAQSGVRRLGGSDSKGMPGWRRKMSQGNKEDRSEIEGIKFVVLTAVTASLIPSEILQPGGFYAAALTQFWLENGPVWKTQRSLSAVQLSAGGRSRLMAQLTTGCFPYILSLQ